MRTRNLCVKYLCVHYDHAQTTNPFLYPYPYYSQDPFPVNHLKHTKQASKPITSSHPLPKNKKKHPPKNNTINHGLRPLQTNSPIPPRPIHLLPQTTKPPPCTPPSKTDQEPSRTPRRPLPNDLSGKEEPDAHDPKACSQEGGETPRCSFEWAVPDGLSGEEEPDVVGCDF